LSAGFVDDLENGKSRVEAIMAGTLMRYRADITAGSLKVSESRVIADLLIHGNDPAGWKHALHDENRLQARNPATARRLARLIRKRLEPMGGDLWKLIRDGSNIVATHACLAAAVKQSPLLGDFLDQVVREQYHHFSPTLSKRLWDEYLDRCRSRDPEMPDWHDSTVRRLRSSVFQTLAQAGCQRAYQKQPGVGRISSECEGLGS
jgi:Putative inner membrane protein (DUF1819)